VNIDFIDERGMSPLPEIPTTTVTTDATTVVSDASGGQNPWANVASDAWRPQSTSPMRSQTLSQIAGNTEASAVSNDVLYIHQLELDLVHSGGLAAQDVSANEHHLGKDSQALLDGRPSILVHDVSQGGAFAQDSYLTGRPSPTISQIGVDTHLNNFGVARDANGVEHFLFTDVDKASPELRNEIDLEKTAVSVLEHAQKSGRSPQEQQQLIAELSQSYLSEIHRMAATGEQPPAALTAQEATGAVRQAMEQSQNQTTDKIANGTASESTASGGKSETVDDQMKTLIASSLSEYARQPGMLGTVAYPPQVVDAVAEKSKSGSSYGMTNYKVSLAAAEPGKSPVEVELKEIVPAPGSSDPGDMHTADAARVVENGQAFDGSASPVLGHAEINGHSYLVRPVDPSLPKISFDQLNFAEQESYVEDVGTVLARMHARNANDLRNITQWANGNDAEIQQNLERFATDYEHHLQDVSAALRSGSST
jgi:uncharacterized protein (DUF2252 family)